MESQVEYPFGRGHTGIRGGNEIWREWMGRIGALHAGTEVVAMFDKHNVVDTLNEAEASSLGIEMDHMDDVSSVICSYGRSHQRETWRQGSPWYPFVCQIDGAVFTLERDNGRRMVDVERLRDCGPNVITLSGDKGQVAELLPVPCFIVDDRRRNVELVQKKGYRSGGVVFRGARKGHRDGAPQPLYPGANYWKPFRICNDPLEWPGLVEEFVRLQMSNGVP